MGSKAGWAVGGAVGGSLALILFVVVILGGGASTSAAAQSLTGGLAPGAALKRYAVPDPAWVRFIVEAGSMCPTITAPIIAAQDQVESGWNPGAVSALGAQGVAQFEPGTWPAYDTPPAVPGPDTPFNPDDAILAQGRYDCALVKAVAGVAKTSGVAVLTLALDAYNAGLRAVLAAGGVPANPQTQAYAPQIEQLADGYTASSSLTGSSPFATAEIDAALGEIGRPYVWGGGTPTGPSGSATAPPGMIGEAGFDCSGLVAYTVFQASQGTITLPHLSEAQVALGQAVAQGIGSQVLASGRLRPGDVIGFYNLDGDNAWDHIGIYLGNGEMVAAPQTGQVVQIENLNTHYWAGARWNVRRFA